MVKRFKKGKPYTLCMIYVIDERNFSEIVRNVTFKERLGDILEFDAIEYTYTVDESLRMVICEPKEGNEKQLTFHLTNIVQGWQF